MYYYDVSVQDYSDWETNFTFSKNNAAYGNSIYCTTVITCIWNNVPGSVVVGGDDISQVFNWSGLFHYDKDDDLSKEIATDTINISFGTNESIRIPPG